MHSSFVRNLAAGVVGSTLIASTAFAQQGSGGTQGSSTSTGGTTTNSSQTTTGATSTTGGGMTSSGLPGTSNTPAGLNLQGMQFGNTSGTSSNQGSTGSSRGRGTIGGRTSTGNLGTGSLGLGGSNLGGGSRSSLSTSQMNRQAERRAQYSVRPDFGPPITEPGSAATVRTSIERSVASVSPMGVKVSMDGSTAILTGPVSSAHESKLAERMALLEPGVKAVRNELVVAGSSSSKP